MSDDAMAKLKKLEQSLGGPNGAPLLIGCDEDPDDIVEALECMEADTEFRLCVREFQGADTYIVTGRTPTSAELTELGALIDQTSATTGAEDEEAAHQGDGEADDDEPEDED